MRTEKRSPPFDNAAHFGEPTASDVCSQRDTLRCICCILWVLFLGRDLHLVLIAAWGMGGAVRESRSALKCARASGAVHGPAECNWSVQRCKRTEGEMKVIVGAAASIPFFHFGSTLMGLVCCLYCLILSVVRTAAYIITPSCYPRASSCTSYLFPQTPTSISVASLVLSSCKRSCDWYVISMCSDPPSTSLLRVLWGYACCFVSLLEPTALQ